MGKSVRAKERVEAGGEPYLNWARGKLDELRARRLDLGVPSLARTWYPAPGVRVKATTAEHGDTLRIDAARQVGYYGWEYDGVPTRFRSFMVLSTGKPKYMGVPGIVGAGLFVGSVDQAIPSRKDFAKYNPLSWAVFSEHTTTFEAGLTGFTCPDTTTTSLPLYLRFYLDVIDVPSLATYTIPSGQKVYGIGARGNYAFIIDGPPTGLLGDATFRWWHVAVNTSTGTRTVTSGSYTLDSVISAYTASMGVATYNAGLSSGGDYLAQYFGTHFEHRTTSKLCANGTRLELVLVYPTATESQTAFEVDYPNPGDLTEAYEVPYTRRYVLVELTSTGPVVVADQPLNATLQYVVENGIIGAHSQAGVPGDEFRLSPTYLSRMDVQAVRWEAYVNVANYDPSTDALAVLHTETVDGLTAPIYGPNPPGAWVYGNSASVTREFTIKISTNGVERVTQAYDMPSFLTINNLVVGSGGVVRPAGHVDRVVTLLTPDISTETFLVRPAGISKRYRSLPPTSFEMLCMTNDPDVFAVRDLVGGTSGFYTGNAVRLASIEGNGLPVLFSMVQDEVAVYMTLDDSPTLPEKVRDRYCKVTLDRASGTVSYEALTKLDPYFTRGEDIWRFPGAAEPDPKVVRPFTPFDSNVGVSTEGPTIAP